MKLPRLLLPFATLFAGASAQATPLSDYLSCGPASFPVITQAPFKSQVPAHLENDRIHLEGGSKSDLGQRWIFDKPVVMDGVTLTGFFSEDMDLMGSRIVSWGFFTREPAEQVVSTLTKSHGLALVDANGVHARPEMWSEQQSKWISETSGDTAGKLVSDTSERVLMVEPAPADLGAAGKGMLTCSLQGNISKSALKSSRPDLL